MLDYKDIIIKHYGLGLSGSAISKQLGVKRQGIYNILLTSEFLRFSERSLSSLFFWEFPILPNHKAKSH